MLPEFRFRTSAARNAATRYLRDNADSCAGRYAMFAGRQADAVFDASMRAHVSKCHSDNNLTYVPVNNDSIRINIRDAFGLCRWIRVDTKIPNQAVALSDSEIALNGLPVDPLTVLPIVCFDIETIGRNENIIPRGVTSDQRLSQLAVTVHTLLVSMNKSVNTYDTKRVYSYVQISDCDAIVRLENDLTLELRQRCGEDTDVHLFADEIALLRAVFSALRGNSFLVKLYMCDNEDDYSKIAC